MEKARKLGEILDWAERGRLVFDLVVGFFGQSLVKKLLASIPQISHDWDTIIAWAIAAVIVFGLIKWQETRATRQVPQASQSTSASSFPAVSTLVPGLPGPTFDVQQFFKMAYFSPITAEAEKNIRIIANEKEPKDPAGFMARFIGVGLVSYVHEQVWHTVFKSQLVMLQAMNRNNGYMGLTAAKDFYDKAAASYPKVYATYSFDQWAAYMKTHGLIIQHADNTLEITWNGKDFLKYLTHWGYDVNAKIG